MTEPEEKPVHLDVKGELSGWKAEDVTEEDLVDDDWIKENTEEV